MNTALAFLVPAFGLIILPYLATPENQVITVIIMIIVITVISLSVSVCVSTVYVGGD